MIKVDDFVTQQSLSEARQKVKYEAFQEVFETILERKPLPWKILSFFTVIACWQSMEQPFH